MNALTQFKNLPETKAEVKTFAEQAINEILNGEVDIKSVFAQMKSIEDAIKLIKTNSRIQNYLIDEVEQDGDSKNAEFTLSGRRVWNFSKDPILAVKKAEVKARETLLKKMNGIDPETGEIVGIQTYSEFVKITLK